jgi:hypothetical protein
VGSPYRQYVQSVAEVRLRNGRCTLTAPEPLPLETVDAIAAFMATVEPAVAPTRRPAGKALSVG